MKRLLFPIILCATLLAAPAAAQMGGPGNSVSNAQPVTDHLGSSMTQDEFNQLADYVDQSKRLTKEDKAKGKTEADLKKEDMAAAADLAKTLNMSCEITDAELVAQGADGMKGYEIACGDGMGYFLGLSASQKPYGLSCLTAQAKHDLDASKGQTDDAECRLPANADLKISVGRVLAGLDRSCAVERIEWMGRSDKSASEYNEAACIGGHGFVLVSPEPGSSAPLHALSCEDAAAQGIRCNLTRVAASVAPAITLQTFKDALTQHNIPCDAGDERVIGQESAKKRYVVEFKCAGRPGGLVAFIPLSGNTAPFETTDCASAAKRGLACKLNGGG